MSKETLVFILGILIFLVPFLGLPTDYKKWILVGAGFVLMIIGYILRREIFLKSLTAESGERRANVFVESSPTMNNTISDIESATGNV